MLDLDIAWRSERGKREGNEDAVRVGGTGGTRPYAVLADGAGGHQRGAEAAERAVQRVARELERPGAAFTPQTLAAAIDAAHAELRDSQPHEAGARRMHATVVVLWFDLTGARALWAHVGDSRLYRLRHGAVDHVTTDDSVVQRMVEAGLLTAEQARGHPRRNELLAALGIEGELGVHSLPQPSTLRDGDAFLLCSDGWWEPLESLDLAATLDGTGSAAQWLDALQRHIESRNAPRQDNFSAVAIWAGNPAESTRFLPDDTLTRHAASEDDTVPRRSA
jgi:serine/threonine protein phosphatase PrpC